MKEGPYLVGNSEETLGLLIEASYCRNWEGPFQALDSCFQMGSFDLQEGHLIPSQDFLDSMISILNLNFNKKIQN